MLSTHSVRSLLFSVATACALVGEHARAQCPRWTPGFVQTDLDNEANALEVFDDGSGSQLYVGGLFTKAGGVVTRGIARWNGSSWSSVGGGITASSGSIEDFAIFDDGLGGGAKLYACGTFTSIGGVSAKNIACWNGTTWAPLGSGLNQRGMTLCVFDLGSGPRLIAGGDFISAGGTSVGRVASWDGTTWSPMSIGMSHIVNALAAFDDGSGGGPQLHAGGEFLNADGVQVKGLAKWNGGAWVGFGGGVDHPTVGWGVHALAAYDDGFGPALFVGGWFTDVGSLTGPPLTVGSIARWNGTTWSQPGGGVYAGGRVYALTVRDDGAGPRLYAAGSFPSIAGLPMNDISRWDGTTWSPAGAGLATLVRDLCSYDDGSGGGEKLYAAGAFVLTTPNGNKARQIARFDGTSWSALMLTGNAVNSNINSLTVFDDGSGSALYAFGNFTTVGEVSANYAARWNGSQWSTVGSGLSAVAYSSVVFDDGSGPALYVGGAFSQTAGQGQVVRWNGTSWASVGGVANNKVNELIVHDDGTGPALYAAGSFTSIGGIAAKRIARWNGATWSALGTGVNGTGLNESVNALCSATIQGVRALYVGGNFSTAGGVPVAFVAKWNGATWSGLSTGFGTSVSSLAEYDDGTGNKLFVGGGVQSPSYSLLRWDGATWSAPIGGRPNDAAFMLKVHDDGTGPSLYVGGWFSNAGGVPASRIARYDSLGWHALGAGIAWQGGLPLQDALPYAAASFADGFGPSSLYLGGRFESSGGIPAFNIARWTACPGPQVSFCAGDGSSTTCPCGNAGDIGSGCSNSAFAGGARLSGAAYASVANDMLVLTATNVPGPGLFIQGTGQQAGGAGITFGDGLLCAGSGITRLGVAFPTGSTVTLPNAGAPNPIHVAGNCVAGDLRHYQFWYRDAVSYCTPATFNLTQGMTLQWSP